MVQRRVADLWRTVAAGVTETVNWADLYKTLLAELAGLVAQGEMPEAELRTRLIALASASQQGKPPSRASVVRERMFDAIHPVRSLLAEITKLPWQANSEHPMTTALTQLTKLYVEKLRELPVETNAPRLGSVWSAAIAGADRERAFRALEVATLFSLRRAVRNGSVWIEHSLSFRGRAHLFLTNER